MVSEDPALVAKLLNRAHSFAQLPSDQNSSQAISDQTVRWDEYTTQWRETELSRILDNVSARFATPVSRPELESPLRTNTSTATVPTVVSAPSHPPPSTSRTKAAPKQSGSVDPKAQSPPPPDLSSLNTMDFAYRMQPIHPEQNDEAAILQPRADLTSTDGQSGSFEVMAWSGDQLNLALADLLGDHPGQSANAFHIAGDPSSSSSSSFPHILQSQSSTSTSTSSFDFGSLPLASQYPWPTDSVSDNLSVKPDVFVPDSFISTSLNESSPGRSAGRAESPDEGEIVPTETDTVRYKGSATGMHHQALESSYTGSFWYV